MNRTELDYYDVLNVPRSATKDEITLAYRKLAIRLCPFRDPKHERDFVKLPNETELTHLAPLPHNRQWDYINMAYDVLGNDLHRAIYDRFGEVGLFQGIFLSNGYFPPYQYHGDNLKVYHEVFGSNSPYANLIDAITNPPELYTTPEHGIGVRTKDPSVEKAIYLELEEVRFGSVKLMHVWRQEFCNAEKTKTEKRKKTLKLNIPPGTTPGTRFCFKEEGDRCPTKIPGDIIFITFDKPHSSFCRRHHHDLVYHKRIDLVLALVGFRFVIETLDKRKLKICINDVVYPGFTKVMPGEGLPKCIIDTGVSSLKPQSNKPKEFGDLIIEFTIIFPIYLNRHMKSFCRQFFNCLKEMQANDEQDASAMQELMQRMSMK